MAKKKSALTFPRSFRKKMQEIKRKNNTARQSRQNLIETVGSLMGVPGNELKVDTRNPEKMSAIIFSYAEPLLRDVSEPDEIKNVLSVAMMAWNMSLVPEEMRHEQIETVMSAVDEMGAGAAAIDHAFFDAMVKRKNKMFPENRRMIVSYDFTDTPDGVHLSVASQELGEKKPTS